MKKEKMYGIAVVLVFLIAISLLSGCENNDATTNDNPINGKTEDKIIIGFSLGTLKEERWIKDRDLFVKRANELGADVNVLSANSNPEVQNSQVESLILQGVDTIVIVPENEEILEPLIEKAHEKGIKVIAYDRLIKNSDLDVYVSFDNVLVGELETTGVLSAVSKGDFAYIGGSPTDNNAFLLKKGSMAALDKKIRDGDIRLVVDEFSPGWNPDEAYKTIKKYLEANKKLDAVIAANDGTAFGAIQALKEYNLSGIVPVSGQDAELGACQRIVEGTQIVTVYKPIELLAYKSAEIAVSIAKGEKTEFNSVVDNGKINVSSYLLSPISVNKENMMETIIKDGFHTYEEVYQNIPENERPKKSGN
jgi:D-xylose transport system substrate-binding protein